MPKDWDEFAETIKEVAETGRTSSKFGPEMVSKAKEEGWKPPSQIYGPKNGLGWGIAEVNRAQVSAAEFLREVKLKSNKEEVPKRLLTGEQVAWTSQFRKAKQVAGVAQRGMLQMREVFQEAMGMLKGLLKNIPKKSLEELGRQPEGEEEEGMGGGEGGGMMEMERRE